MQTPARVSKTHITEPNADTSRLLTRGAHGTKTRHDDVCLCTTLHRFARHMVRTSRLEKKSRRVFMIRIIVGPSTQLSEFAENADDHEIADKVSAVHFAGLRGVLRQHGACQNVVRASSRLPFSFFWKPHPGAIVSQYDTARLTIKPRVTPHRGRSRWPPERLCKEGF